MVKHVVKPFSQQNKNPCKLSVYKDFLVGVTGFEPAASWSRRVKKLFFGRFAAVSAAFRSGKDALVCSSVRCFRVFRVCLWSDMWS